MAGSTENSTKKKRGNPQNLILWKPGQSGNPTGRKLGQRNRKTVIMEAIKRLATANDMSPEDIEELIQASGIQKSIKGSFLHYAEISNGLYGKVSDKVDITSGGMTLADLMNLANAKPKREPRGKSTGKVSK